MPDTAHMVACLDTAARPNAWIDSECAHWLRTSALRPLQLLGRTLLPIVRGGMGIGVSAHRLAGGHLGAAKIADLGDPRFDFEKVIPQSLAFLRSAGIERENPIIAAGGIRTRQDIRRVQDLGAAAVQMGTPFAVTTEGDADPAFKQVLAQATDAALVEFTSVAGLPARAVRTPWLDAYLRIEHKLQAVAHPKARCTKSFDCLAQCGLRDGFAQWRQFCIDNPLAAALRGDVRKGLFFRGAGALPFGDQIRSVRALVQQLLVPEPALLPST